MHVEIGEAWEIIQQRQTDEAQACQRLETWFLHGGNAMAVNGDEALIEALVRADWVEGVNIALRHGFHPSDLPQPALLLCLAPSGPMARRLTEAAVPVNPDPATATPCPVETAVREDRREVLDVLLHHGADPNIRLSNGGCPLHFAAHLGRVEIVRALLALGADVNNGEIHGETPLLAAIAELNVDVTRVLLDAGADVEARRQDGLTALRVTLASPTALPADEADKRRLNIFEMLLNAGASLARDEQAESLAELAQRQFGVESPVTQAVSRWAEQADSPESSTK
ncbi:ankyrin repeat domain-containing protein [Chitiniphilus eburneus]|uniref:Ankyrin repeat domain-containing protein n=1 Tax=Chitiniphilus eburneus TaxID=2571148 RepID=A0A4U0QJJ5_9NEIS|nr:ankyrin repeat domain-containing protein [Chitiniphilus eburneus]TJZ76234.1 ankyrin repeat domain-containing protein [Chitiniphilus eburneus]